MRPLLLVLAFAACTPKGAITWVDAPDPVEGTTPLTMDLATPTRDGARPLLVFIHGTSLQKVAGFVSEKLASLEGVLSTSTHFMLRCYKEQGYLLNTDDAQDSRLNVAP